MNGSERNLVRAHSYTTDERERQSLDTWMKSASVRPDIFIIAPAVRDVGEQRLIDELADASYRLGSHRDARRRHRMERAFPTVGTAVDYKRFLDEPFATAEITDEFFGLDVIDLTAWIDKDFNQPDCTWPFLISHIIDHPETDFVFTVYTDTPDKASIISQRIMTDTGISLETVHLECPGPNELAAEFHVQSNGEFIDHADYVLEQFGHFKNMGKLMNYAFARSCALYSLHQLAVQDNDSKAALIEAFAHYSEMTVVHNRTNSIGFL